MTDVKEDQSTHVKYVRICQKDDWCICEIVPEDFDLKSFDGKFLSTNISITPINSNIIPVARIKTKSVSRARSESPDKKKEQDRVVNTFHTEVRRKSDVKSMIPKWQSEPEKKYTDINRLGNKKINIIDRNTEDETSIRNVFSKHPITSAENY